jgi:hypothetical protein
MTFEAEEMCRWGRSSSSPHHLGHWSATAGRGARCRRADADLVLRDDGAVWPPIEPRRKADYFQHRRMSVDFGSQGDRLSHCRPASISSSQWVHTPRAVRCPNPGLRPEGAPMAGIAAIRAEGVRLAVVGIVLHSFLLWSPYHHDEGPRVPLGGDQRHSRPRGRSGRRRLVAGPAVRRAWQRRAWLYEARVRRTSR